MFQDDLQQGDNQQVSNIVPEESRTTTTTQEAQQQTPQQIPQQQQTVEPVQQIVQPEIQTPVIPVIPPVKTTQDERVWGAISYIAFLGIITLAMNPTSKFCKNHAAQGLLLFIFWFIGLIVMAVPFFLTMFFGGILFFGVMGLGVFGMYKAFTSYELNIPIFSDLAKKMPVDSITESITGKTIVDTEVPQVPVAPAAPEKPEQPNQDQQ
ncbi:hypothetical protein KKD70_03225 [Patescibacteria group bacterium]|nr:hypothetical protein [Patescibacteria group bacterium]